MDKKKRALVTGGAKRIGAEIVKYLAENGFAVTVHVWQSQAEAEELIKNLPSAEAHCVSVCDFSDPQARKEWLKSIGTFDLVVNNASAYRLNAPGSKEPTEIRQRYWQINYLAAVEIATHAAAKNSQALVINMLDSDILNNRGGVKDPVEPPIGEDYYLYSRIMLGHMTAAMAAEYAPEVRINGIAPGPVLPPVNCTTPGMTQVLKDVPMKRPAAIGEILAAIGFFRENASLTGVILPVDGGKHLNDFSAE